MDIIYWNHYYNPILLFNLLIVIGLFVSLRLFSGALVHIDATRELLKKDNPAFGISLAAAVFAVTIMLSGTIYGSQEEDIQYTSVSVGAFGVAGILLMSLTRLIFSKITLPRISMREEIKQGNIAVAIADAGNIIAAAIIIRAALVWVSVHTLDGAIAMLGAYAVSQFILTAMTLIRMRIFGIVNNGDVLQDDLKSGNVALALVFAGRKIGTAFAIAAAASIVVYDVYSIPVILLAWFVSSIAAILIWKLICTFAEAVIFYKADLNLEITKQRNAAVGAVLAVINIAIGLLITSL